MNSNDIAKSFEITTLYDFYKNLLTDKQKEYFELYFFEDLTLQEISQEYNVSRNAVYDSISKTSTILLEFEQKLLLKAKSERLRIIVDKIKMTNLLNKQLILELEQEI